MRPRGPHILIPWLLCIAPRVSGNSRPYPLESETARRQIIQHYKYTRQNKIGDGFDYFAWRQRGKAAGVEQWDSTWCWMTIVRTQTLRAGCARHRSVHERSHDNEGQPVQALSRVNRALGRCR